MRIMCDTNILVRCALSADGPATELVDLVLREHLLVTSSAVLSEFYDVMRRPQIRAIHRLPERQIRRMTAKFAQAGTLARLPAILPQTVPRDPKDNPIVMTAVVGQAEVLCTLDKHLHVPDVVAYCQTRGIRVARDVELLFELRV